MVIDVYLGSRATLREVLERLDIIYLTKFQDLPDTWHDRTNRFIHPGPKGHDADYVYFDQWPREKLDSQNAWSGSNATRVVSDDNQAGWPHYDAGMEETRRNTAGDYDAYRYGDVTPSPTPPTYDRHSPGPSSSNAVVRKTNHEISHVAPSNAQN